MSLSSPVDILVLFAFSWWEVWGVVSDDCSCAAQRNTPNDGLGRWTTQKDKVINPDLFRNGGLSYWETEDEPYMPSVRATDR